MFGNGIDMEVDRLVRDMPTAPRAAPQTPDRPTRPAGAGTGAFRMMSMGMGMMRGFGGTCGAESQQRHQTRPWTSAELALFDLAPSDEDNGC